MFCDTFHATFSLREDEVLAGTKTMAVRATLQAFQFFERGPACGEHGRRAPVAAALPQGR